LLARTERVQARIATG